MVWALFPLESLPGARKYYIFSKGTYNIGRKDCDVIIQVDRAISRVHAEIIIDVMAPHGSSRNRSSVNIPNVRIRDLSKFGTFINKELGSQAVHTFPNKEAILKDGDLVSFGTGSATFRFCLVPLIAFVDSSNSFETNPSFEATTLSIGAQITHRWSPECTHMIVDESTAITAGLISVVLAQKPVVHFTWFMNLGEKNIRTEIPSCTLHVPNLMLDGTSVKVVEPRTRENCLEGYTFVLGQSHLYKFGSKLPSLIQLVGGRILRAHEISSGIQASADGEKNQMVLVIPEGSSNELNDLNHLISLPRVRDVQLVAAALSGNLDHSMLEPASTSIVVSSSHSTDETIVAESDMENDTAASKHLPAAVTVKNAIKIEDKKDLEQSEDETRASKTNLSQKEPISFKVEESIIISRSKDDESETASHQSSDIFYSQALIVRDIIMPSSVSSASERKVANFKCFRKNETVSGNSFKNLIPFSQEPFHESDYENKEVAEYMREEKKRKQMEAIAEDLFNNEKAKKRQRTGSLHSFLVRQ